MYEPRSTRFFVRLRHSFLSNGDEATVASMIRGLPLRSPFMLHDKKRFMKNRLNRRKSHDVRIKLIIFDHNYSFSKLSLMHRQY